MNRSEWSQLHLAVESNNLSRVKELIKNGADVDEVTKVYKNTILHVCANEGNIDIMKELLKVCTLLNKKNRSKDTTLHIAVKEGHADVVKLLLRHGIDINATNKKGNTALHLAIICLTQIAEYEVKEKQKLNLIIKILIDGGASIEILNKAGMTSLAIAAKNNLLEAAQNMVNGRSGSVIDCKCINDKTALYFAASEGHVDVTKLLIEANAKTDVRIQDDVLTTILHSIAITDRENTLSLFSLFKEEVHLLNNQGDTALMLAVQNGLVNSTGFLVLCGSSIADRRMNGMTALKFAAQMKDTNLLNALNTYGDLLNTAIQENDLMIIESVAECGFNFNTDHLLKAIIKKVDGVDREENLKIIRFLIRTVSNVSELYTLGRSVLGYVIVYKKEDVCDDLLAVGCVPSISDMCDAMKTSNRHIVRSFLKYDFSFEEKYFIYVPLSQIFEDLADEEFKDSLKDDFDGLEDGTKREFAIDQLDSLGRTALYMAVANKHTNLVGEFLEMGADPNFKVNHKKYPTALHKAASYMFPIGNIQELIEAGSDVNSLNSSGETPLFLAADRKNAEELIKGGSNIYHKNDAGETILHGAVQNLAINADINDYLIFLLRHCSDLLDIFSETGLCCTPLYKAIILRKFHVAAELIHHGADCNLGRLDPDISSVMLVQEQNNPYLLDLMIRAGASLSNSTPVVVSLFQQCILFIRCWLKKIPGGIFNNLKLMQNMENINIPIMVIDMIMLRRCNFFLK